MTQSCAMIYLPGGLPTPISVALGGTGWDCVLRRPVEWQARVTHLALPSFGRKDSMPQRADPCIVFFDLISKTRGETHGRKEPLPRKQKGLDMFQEELLGRFGPELRVREFQLKLTLAGMIAAPELNLSLARTLRQLVVASSGRTIEDGKSCLFWRSGHGVRYQCGMCAPLGGSTVWMRDA